MKIRFKAQVQAPEVPLVEEQKAPEQVKEQPVPEQAPVIPEASEAEIESALIDAQNKNTLPMEKLLKSKKLDPFYHMWIMDLFTDTELYEAANVDVGEGPYSKYKTYPKLPDNLKSLYNTFISSQQPDSRIIDMYMNKARHWYNPVLEQKQVTTLFDALNM